MQRYPCALRGAQDLTKLNIMSYIVPLCLRHSKCLAVSGVGAVFPTARNFQNFFPKPDTGKILRFTKFIGKTVWLLSEIRTIARIKSET